MILNKLSHLQQRLIVGAVSCLIAIFFIVFSFAPYFQSAFTLATAGVISLALWEYYHIAAGKGFFPLSKVGIIATFAYVYATFLTTQCPAAEMLPPIILVVTLLTAFLYYFIKGSNPFENLAITVFGIAYLTVPLSYIVNINFFFGTDGVQDGRWWLLYLLLTTKATDIGAFFIGKKLGKHQLTPYISPKKTWEGAAGGLLCAISTSIFLFFLSKVFLSSNIFTITLWQSLWLSILISIIAQIGDLAESLLKRDVGVKDSNTMVPGLGGFLDMVDSVVFTAPILYFFLKMQMQGHS